MPFRDSIGHRALLHLLARAVARRTLPPSLIFEGPEGVGKRLVARALAQALNCESPVDGEEGLEIDACGTCLTCRRIERGLHADVLVIEPGETGSIKVEQARAVVEQAAYRPFEGRRRVVIVDQADAMVAEAQNALLKTLEEPPAGSVFVLVTARPEVLLPTVRSRCPRLRFGRLSEAEIAHALQQRHAYDEPDARAAAAVADGSLAQALQAHSDELVAARQAAARVLTETAATTDPRRRLEGARTLTSDDADRAAVALRLHAMAALLRDVEILCARTESASLANADLRSGLQPLAKAYESGRGLRAFSAVNRALAALDRNASPKIVADWLVFQL